MLHVHEDAPGTAKGHLVCAAGPGKARPTLAAKPRPRHSSLPAPSVAWRDLTWGPPCSGSPRQMEELGTQEDLTTPARAPEEGRVCSDTRSSHRPKCSALALPSRSLPGLSRPPPHQVLARCQQHSLHKSTKVTCESKRFHKHGRTRPSYLDTRRVRSPPVSGSRLARGLSVRGKGKQREWR